MKYTYYIHIFEQELHNLDLSKYRDLQITTGIKTQITLAYARQDTKLEKQCIEIDCSLVRVDCDNNETTDINYNESLPIITNVAISWN